MGLILLVLYRLFEILKMGLLSALDIDTSDTRAYIGLSGLYTFAILDFTPYVILFTAILTATQIGLNLVKTIKNWKKTKELKE